MRCILIWGKSLVIPISKKFECTLQQIGTFYKKWTLHINFSCEKGRHFWKTCALILQLNMRKKLLWWVRFTQPQFCNLIKILSIVYKLYEGILLVRSLPDCKIYFQWEFEFRYLGSEFRIPIGNAWYLQQQMC